MTIQSISLFKTLVCIFQFLWQLVVNSKLTVDAHHIQQIRPDLPQSVDEGVHSMDKPLCCLGEKLEEQK